MKQRIQFIVTIIIALIIGASFLSIAINAFFKALLFMMKNPLESLLITISIMLAGWAINKALSKE